VALGLGVAWHLGEAVAAPKLGMGAARCGHPVFMARSSLGRKARTRRGACGVGSGVAESNADTRGRKKAPLTCGAGCQWHKAREERSAARLAGLVCQYGPQEREERGRRCGRLGRLLGHRGRRAEARRESRPSGKMGRAGKARPLGPKEGEEEIPSFFQFHFQIQIPTKFKFFCKF